MTTPKPEPTASEWIDGDPLMEAIANTVWEQCAPDDKDMPQLVCDDPRTIAAVAAAVARTLAAGSAPATDQAARAQRYGQVLRRWGLLDEVNDPKAAEEFAVTGLLAVADAEQAALRAEVERLGDWVRSVSERATTAEADRDRYHDELAVNEVDRVAAVARVAELEQQPPDRAELREQIAAAVRSALPTSSGLAREVVAEAVLAALPAPVDQAAERQALDRVRALHSRDSVGRCSYCTWLDDQAGSGLDVSHPCDTIRAAELERSTDAAPQPAPDPATSLARHITAQPISIVQAALRLLGWPITFDVQPAVAPFADRARQVIDGIDNAGVGQPDEEARP